MKKLDGYNKNESRNTTNSRLTSGRHGKAREESEEFRARAYHTWFTSGQPSVADFIGMLSEEARIDPVHGCYITDNQIRNMISDFQAPAYMDDQRVREKIQERAVSDRVKMLERQLPEFVELQTKGIEFIREKGFNTARDALAGYKLGVEFEREARGIPMKELEEITNMTEEQIRLMLEQMAEEGDLLDSQDTKGALPPKTAT